MIKKKNQLIQRLVILIFFLTGLLAVKNYGISYDEVEYRQQGFIMLNHLAEKIFPKKVKKIIKEKKLKYPSPEEYMIEKKSNFKIHHTLFAAIEYLTLSNGSKKDAYLMRHYINFFMSAFLVLFFYRSISITFGKTIGFLSSCFLILNPKIYPHFIYNPNDIWFTFFLTASIYCSLYFLKKSKLKYLFFIPIFIAFAINIRIIGVYYCFIFAGILFLKYFYEKKSYKELSKIILIQFLILILIFYIITPEIWNDPIVNSMKLFYNQLFYSSIDPQILFLGEMMPAAQVPWYYLPFWIFISIPTLYLILFFIGVLFFIYEVVLKKQSIIEYKNILIFLYLFIPILAAIFLKPTIFNDWRHFYFLYPGIIYFSSYSLSILLNKLNFKKIIIFCLILNSLNLVYWSIKHHPHEFVFLNYFSKKYSSKIERDYWGLANLTSIKSLLKLNKGKLITIAGLDGERIDFTFNMLDKDELKKIKIVKMDEYDNEKIDYFITQFNNDKSLQLYKNRGFKLYKTIEVDNQIINATFLQAPN